MTGNMEGMQSSPDIHVGIIKRDRISLRFYGSYELTGIRDHCTGSYEAFVEQGSMIVQREGDRLDAGREASFIPLDFGNASFAIRDVVIGIDFHWEQKEDQKFQGSLRLLVTGNEIQAVNMLPVEHYLCSVISSEMSANSSLNLLKAHAIISRSWVLVRMGMGTAPDGTYSGQPGDAGMTGREADPEADPEAGPETGREADPGADRDAGTRDEHAVTDQHDQEYLRWYDHTDHEGFHVCADDHCQRYQGITRIHNPNVTRAVSETFGQVLIYGNTICDTRYSKSCGGVTELFENCWEPVPHPYLQKVIDSEAPSPTCTADLRIEEHARTFICSTPDAFCNTQDAAVLSQVLNDYDRSSKDFFRWVVRYSQQELSTIIAERSGIDFGQILDLVPVERGSSGRLVRLKIAGTRKILTIGKELIIRRWLSRSHLYSSAFIIEKESIENGIPGAFIILGAGWGHGVGLCQIGAAVMAEKGYSHTEILKHYFKGDIVTMNYQ